MQTGEASSFFSQVIRDVREERQLSQEEFARLCGVTQPAVVKWERGRPLAEATLTKVASALGLPIEALLYQRVVRGYRAFLRRRRHRKERSHARRAS